MGVIKLLECDGCEEATFKKEEPHFYVRGKNAATGAVGKLVLCVKCGRELFDGKLKGDTADAETPATEGEGDTAALDNADAPAPAKTTPAPAKATPAKQAQAKAS